ncbi:putative transcriptional regulator with C-terminal CBS domains [Neoasaia chiangmaiensis NBRC 101099]|uniref:Transcriptional regulator n=1 Tax=Neoasaia chiangmaiensis TaxID=320497 RepID=A0A1U9KQW0_9PROT|nr:XRE family transcriptional regulator [Neoasaia chiangmaiensis]AQS88193.1 transcriptional regulator [Neoasaia chiangmaiensis]GBR39895.1 putative transcriptional regulator with C-terminal CBS domains [Neoasaia chiangmaiensis NBRC 101099]GEN14790.1 transcriptional regulator [Neoasaia chiangmaiensis]
MTKRKTLASLGAKLTPTARERASVKARAMSDAMDLAELRKAHVLSQKQIAELLGVNQASVAKMEKRADMYVSTLRSYIQAMGGELEIVARFPDHAVPIRSFAEIGQDEELCDA